MAANVFGTPVTRTSLAKLAEYKCKEITTREMARVAFETKNEDGKDVRARAYVEERRAKHAIESVLCLIYNATGDTIRLETYSDIAGYVAPTPYPMLIMNGQWGAYLKVGGGAVVYTVKNEAGVEYQVVYTYRAVQPGRVYTELKGRGHYTAKDTWQTYATPLDANKTYFYQVHDYGLSSFATIGVTFASPVFEGIITLDGAWPNYTKIKPCYQPCIGVEQEVEGRNASVPTDDN